MDRVFAKVRKPGGKRAAARPSGRVSRPVSGARAETIGRLVTASRVQAKLRIGAPGDAYEREADQVADRVMRMPEAAVQRMCTDCEEEQLQRQPLEEEEETLQTKPLVQRMCAECGEERRLQRQPLEEEEEMLQTKPRLQRMCAECEEQALQARESPGAIPEVDAGAAAEIRGLSGGRPLPAAERAFFEPRMGADFGGVRLHTGPRAEALAAGVGARAFTHGRDVVFGRGEYGPGSSRGRELMAHELTHVLQQRREPQRVQRLTITRYSLTKGTCDERNVQWVFKLDKKAPEDGYIVQQVDRSEMVDTCPDVTVGPPAPMKPFWEAWFVKKDDKVDWTTTRDKWTDGSTRRKPRTGTSGSYIAVGEVKFFKKSTTGDLGDFNKAPADPKSDWGPGKVPTSGRLPSTATKPSWWSGSPVEGPADRGVWSWWNCCDKDKSKHTYSLVTKP